MVAGKTEIQTELDINSLYGSHFGAWAKLWDANALQPLDKPYQEEMSMETPRRRAPSAPSTTHDINGTNEDDRIAEA